MASTPLIPESPVVESFFTPVVVQQEQFAEASSSASVGASAGQGLGSGRFGPGLRDPSPRTYLPLLEAAEEAEAVEKELGGGLGDGGDGDGDGGLEGAASVSPGIVLRHALRWAVEHADLECVSWLVNLTGDRVCSALCFVWSRGNSGPVLTLGGTA